MRTQGRLDCDTGYGDGHIFFSALDGTLISGTGTATRAGSGLYSLNLGASDTAILSIPLSSLIFRYGSQDFLQEQFGSLVAQGAQGFSVGGYTANVATASGVGSFVNVAVNTSVGFSVGRSVSMGAQQTKITAIPDATHITLQAVATTLAVGSTITESIFTTPAGVTGIPPFSGLSQLTPTTSPRPKGIGIKGIYPVYGISGAALTTNTIGITKTAFSNIAAPVVTNIIADAANTLATSTNAQPYVTPINLATPAIMQVTKYASYSIEWDVTTAGGGAAQLYGVFLDVLYNYN